MAGFGMRMPVFAPGTYSDSGATTYANGFIIGRGISVNLNLNYSEMSLDADDHSAEHEKKCTGGSITEVVSELTEAAKTGMLGRKKSGNAIVTGDDDAPYGGHGYITGDMTNGVKKYVVHWIYKTQLTSDGNAANTLTSGGGSFANVNLSGVAMKAYEGYEEEEEYATFELAWAALKAKADIKD